MGKHDVFKPGLEGVIAGETGISYLDTAAEEIVIRGYDLIRLAEQKTYLDILYLLIQNKLPDAMELKGIESALKNAYDLPNGIYTILSTLPQDTHPMDALRTGISALSGYDPELNDRSKAANAAKALRLIAQVPNIAANSYRILHQQKAIMPNKQMSYSQNFLYMLTGKEPSEQETDVFDQTLVLYSEHEMPNSTFAARVIASTNSDIYGAFTGAAASLKGNLHGGANEAVMHMLLEGETKSGFIKLIQQKLANKEKIMGFGHRVYMRKMDPRAALLKKALFSLSHKTGRQDLYDMCDAGETLMREEKGLYPNLDYYAAPVYYLLGIPIDLYTPIFFAARSAGLSAHVIEQHDENRLFRPRVRYTGPRGLQP
ncbi:citrate synthase 3 [Bacillus glycinifermentans]|uniref:Citrate synthase n=1 Tax=Bacillus glycinifermentans TaxID=1664069 RepID=A0A0J6HBZ4_9BACI|nr:citrate synthase [Bacillus glycinifermentans]ATH93709.1 citrate synthase 3 [Bacillus glycinifermentans]KMM56717.1 citrate synthase 3 [Bacillus glycinifermentans]KRT90116.1 citrate synthase 3 [Bacillus glycinifermentans]MEC0483799.1 citrate synthase [Bacillus glycinifermentans]MEC0496293.1 citrate synthase [Bacillus glycinifermentans]